MSSALLKDSIANYEAKNFSLIYKGSDNGFGRKDFRNKINDIGGFATFILSDYGYVFGMYTARGFK